MASRVTAEDEALERLAASIEEGESGADDSSAWLAAVEARHAEAEDDEEAALDELIKEFADIRPGAVRDEEFMREDEFACRACHMILHRSHLVDRRRRLCSECA